MIGLESEAEYNAKGKRRDLGFDDEPVAEIFDLIESLNIVLLKKPLGRDSLSALFLNYKDDFLILINSSKSLGHQHFSAAHELYHYFFDQGLNGNICNAFKFKRQDNESEAFADYFAVHFLMPGDGIKNFMNRLGISRVGFKETIKAQNYFKVSYKAMLVRLKVLGYLNEQEYEELSRRHLGSAFKRLGYPLSLVRPTEETYVSRNYIELVTEHYDNEEIGFSAFKRYLNDVGYSVEELEPEGGEAEENVEETAFDY